jgi:hypothetical protein
VIKRIYHGAQFACASVVLLLAACGGGGGGGGGGSGPDLSTAPGLTVSPNSVTFTAVQNGAIPSTQNVQITISQPNAVFIGVGFPPGTTPPTWLDQNPSRLTGAGNNWTLTGAILTTNLALGTYTTTLRVAIADGAQNVLAYRDVQVSYTVQPLAGFSATPTSLSFSQLQGAAAPSSQTLGIAELGGASYAWNASIVYQSGSGWLTVNGATSTSGATLPTSLAVGVNSTPALGTLNALIRVTGNGHTLDVPVSYTVAEPTLTRSPASLTFNASSQGTTPATQDVTLTTQGSLPLNYTTSVTYGVGANGWLTAPAGTAPGPVTVGVNTTNLAQGTYTATLSINTAAQTVSVGVNYVVAAPSLTFTPASASFTIDTTSLPSATTQNVAVGSTSVALSWIAASSQPWVTVTPTSGSSGIPVTLNLIPVELDALDPGPHSADIVFSYTPPGGSFTTANLAVSLNLLLPKVDSVNPYVATSGTSKEVILRGAGFNNTGGAAINFGISNSVSSYTVVSDTEIRVTHPSLLQNTYRVSIANQLINPNIVRSAADLVVRDAPLYAAATINYPDSATKRPLHVIYDAERQALLVATGLPDAGGANSSIYRYAFSGSAWPATPSTVVVPQLRDAVLSPDGKKLLAATDTAVSQFDAATLAAGGSTNVTLSVLQFLNRLAVANDGNAFVTTGINGSGFTDSYFYSIRNATLIRHSTSDFINARCTGSEDGSRLVIIQSGVSPAQNISQYNASNGFVSTVNLPLDSFGSEPAANRNATRLILSGSEVYNGNFQKLGNLPFAFTVALSPDGSKAYQFSGGQVHAYDLNGALTPANPDTGVFPEIGGGTTPSSDPGLVTVMTVSPDGGTLFIAGSNSVAVVPAP